jgi:hypothetical protein
LLDDDTFNYHSQGDLALDAGLFVASPTALPAGISTGVAAGVTRGCGCSFAYGARASWSTDTGSTSAWTVTQWDLRLRASGLVRKRAGRGTFALRLDVGGTVVHEDRVRTQSMAAQLVGGPFEQNAFALMPAGELEGVVSLHIAGPWLAVVSAGPSLVIDNGAVHGGFVAGLGVAWQP